MYIDEGTKVVNISNKSGSNYILAVSKNNSFLIDKYKTLKEKSTNKNHYNDNNNAPFACRSFA